MPPARHFIWPFFALHFLLLTGITRRERSYHVSLTVWCVNSFLISRIGCECNVYVGNGGDTNFQINKTNPLKLTLLTLAQLMLFIMKLKKMLRMLY